MSFPIPDPRRMVCARCAIRRLLPAEREYIPRTINQYRCKDRELCKAAKS